MRFLLLLALASTLSTPPHPSTQPGHPLCTAAATFLRTDRSMAAIVEPDTIDDWRTQKKVPGCKITAAGGTARGVQPEAVAFYERIRAVGWTRTPDPRDAPNEASLRFRQGNVDCLFNVYGPAMLMTEAEDKAGETRALQAGEQRYHVYVMCMPAMPAAPRE
ncbi:hypothetical protein [Gemmatimonas sp.]|jgi:hypothetical protein|uniref:hypothetical protein n=1 Tax=Gemmatimonas sp. TaxID=1962908 RepID=UPI0031BDBCBD|nr:hypothetical protein [Gemmatimonas sp.]